MTLIAKPIVKNRLWIVLDEGNKVGNVEADERGYKLQLGKIETHYDTTNKIEDFVKIKFERPPVNNKQSAYGPWPATGKTYNEVMDVKRKLQLFTKTEHSKCYHVRGWFKIKLNDSWQVMLCPKYIFVTRYQYMGPYMTRQEAEQA